MSVKSNVPECKRGRVVDTELLPFRCGNGILGTSYFHLVLGSE